MGSYTIIGAGAIGGIVGAHLIENGHHVIFVETNEGHIEAIRTKGLTIVGHRQIHVSPQVVLPQEVDFPLEKVLLAVKSRHTRDALAPLAERVVDNGFVVSLQNGLEEYKIAQLVGQHRTIGAFLTFGGHYEKPGQIVYGGPGSFVIGELDGAFTPRVNKLQSVFSYQQRVSVTNNIFGYLWSKMALGAVYFATALVSANVPEIYSVAKYREGFGRLATEVVKVAKSQGVSCESVDGFDPTVFLSPKNAEAVASNWEAQIFYWASHAQDGIQRTGVWRDLAIHKRKTEVDTLVGSIEEIAEEENIATPCIKDLVSLVHEVESGARELGWHNLDELFGIST